ncbi:MAG: tetratricopeptide repeat protein [Candidatus Krumholzibacteria bacterium]|jgi:tetratricopeptide (TPR) repeat protein|nr:tetratricopeptide repeat protein [Candidatus Krumholzibacteria bacterium]
MLESGIRDNPASIALRVLLARLLTQSGDLDRARNEYEEVLKRDPSNLSALRVLTPLRLEAGRREETGQMLDRWAAEDPDDLEREDLQAQWEDLSGSSPEDSSSILLPPDEELEEILTRPESSSGGEDPEDLDYLPAPSLRDPADWELPEKKGETGGNQA